MIRTTAAQRKHRHLAVIRLEGVNTFSQADPAATPGTMTYRPAVETPPAATLPAWLTIPNALTAAAAALTLIGVARYLADLAGDKSK